MRRPGLIRWNFFGYLIVVATLGLAYLFLGLDGHVKRLIEQKLSVLNGANVHIGKASFRVSRKYLIHLTSPSLVCYMLMEDELALSKFAYMLYVKLFTPSR